MNILVIGGAGYIGSHICLELLKNNDHIIVFDNLSKGTKKNLFEEETFIKGDITNKIDLDNLFSKNKIDVVFHFAALKAAGESMYIPEKYSENNITGTLNILNTMVKHNVKNFVFSSSAAIFGEPEKLPIDETHRVNPENYYGYTKLAIEENLYWYSKIHNINFAVLRYFNAAGYDNNLRIKGLEKDVTNLIPASMEVLFKKREVLEIFGTDYPTKDGSCIRDYIHVTDLADAHIKALNYILKNKKNITVNLGQGKGTSVLEVVASIKNITKKTLNTKISPRRKGDPSEVIASSKKAKELLGWEPKYSDIDNIIKTTYEVYKYNHNKET